MENEFHQELRTALDEYFQAVESQKNPEPEKRMPLRPSFEKLDGLAARLPGNVDPQLRHYMAQKSYQKAFDHLKAS
jgi:hypothetical protein